MIGAVDIGGTKIAVGMVDDNGKVLSRMEASTDPNRYSDSMELIAHMLRKTAQRAGAEISGVGIGSTGPVDPMRGEFGDVDFLPGWRGKSPVKDLSAVFNVLSRSKMTATRPPWPKPGGVPAAIARA